MWCQFLTVYPADGHEFDDREREDDEAAAKVVDQAEDVLAAGSDVHLREGIRRLINVWTLSTTVGTSK